MRRVRVNSIRNRLIAKLSNPKKLKKVVSRSPQSTAGFVPVFLTQTYRVLKPGYREALKLLFGNLCLNEDEKRKRDKLNKVVDMTLSIEFF
jgi:hypothetical protein